jgi:hypothetical protein
MISEKHSQAARANGARSRGPVTPKGKANSSQNATRHGLLAKTVVLSNENADLFAANVDELIERFNPADEIEMAAIEEMAAAHWRLRRNLAIEHAVLEAGLAIHPPAAGFRQTAAAFSDPANLPVLNLLHRYETRLQNIYQRAYRTLCLLRKSANRKPEPAPEPIPPVPNEPIDPIVCNTEPDAALPLELPEAPFERPSVTITLTDASLAPFPAFVFP